MRIVTFKTAYYSFYLPVACGMLIAGIDNPAAFQTAKDIFLIMGQYFQVCFPSAPDIAAATCHATCQVAAAIAVMPDMTTG